MCRCASIASLSDNSTATMSHTNYRYLSTPKKCDHMRALHTDRQASHTKAERLRLKLQEVIAEKECLWRSLWLTIFVKLWRRKKREWCQVNIPENFWKQQWEVASRDPRGMRWHPAMIKWCLFLRHQSSWAYETIHQSRCICLPSQCILRDYSQCVTVLSRMLGSPLM